MSRIGKSSWRTIGLAQATAEVAGRYTQADSRIRVFRQENRGVAVSRNEGLARSDPRRPLVVFLDHDDMLEPDALRELSSLLWSNPQLPAAHCEARYVDAAANRFRMAGTVL